MPHRVEMSADGVILVVGSYVVEVGLESVHNPISGLPNVLFVAMFALYAIYQVMAFA